MPTFNSYTGNAMLNNALLTVEALADLSSVREITSELLLDQLEKRNMGQLFKRMKCYTMLFTKNGPLHQDAEKGELIYRSLLTRILKNVELEGPFQCELSGLRFTTPFSEFYTQTLLAQGFPEKDVLKKDRSINRCWFPLIGGLGSDAQALPQAKFDIRIHPICLVVMQFLPFSAILYKGGVLLFDAVNEEIAQDFIRENVEMVLNRTEIKAAGQTIANIKDFNKGHYLLRAIRQYDKKNYTYDDRYTDINLWSFTNSGTGASCEIDRIPGGVFKKVFQLYKKTDCRPDLERILQFNAPTFLDSLQNRTDYWGLYPKKDFDGVGIPFFDEYQRLIGRDKHLEYARYIAGLIGRATLTKADEKILAKTDACNQEEYASFFQKVLVQAAERGEWSLTHHLDILDYPDALPVSSSTAGIFKKVHFYFQKKGQWEAVETVQPSVNFNQIKAGQACAFIIRLLEMDETKTGKGGSKQLKDTQSYQHFSLQNLLVRQSAQITLPQIAAFFARNGQLINYGLNFLLRLYFTQPQPSLSVETSLPDAEPSPWLERLDGFAELYFHYYEEKYAGDRRKFQKHVLTPFPQQPGAFLRWLADAFEQMRTFYAEQKQVRPEIGQFEDSLCYDDAGYFNAAFARFAVEFSLSRKLQLQDSLTF